MNVDTFKYIGNILPRHSCEATRHGEEAMKGIVFVHFMEMIEEKFGLQMEDHLVNISNLPSGGIYTAVGTYDHTELLELVKRLSNETGEAAGDIVTDFGRYLFSKLAESYGHLLNNIPNVFSLLTQVDGFIHVEVRKLYPEAELPSFQHELLDDRRLELIYRSPRPFENLARGLIEGAIAYYNEPVRLEKIEPMPGVPNQYRFLLTR